MNYIWITLVAISLIFGLINHRLGAVFASILPSLKSSVQVGIYIVIIMGFWLGIMKIAEKSGLVNNIAKFLTPLGKRIFPELPKNEQGEEIIGDVAFNFSANTLGLGNAATPMGIKAIKQMQKLNIDKTSASNSMCMLLSMNTASFQLIPVTVIGILAAGGSNNPTEVILPTLIVTSISFVMAIIYARVFEKIWKPQTPNEEVTIDE